MRNCSLKLLQEDEHCWVGELNGLVGWFPAKFVQVKPCFLAISPNPFLKVFLMRTTG